MKRLAWMIVLSAAALSGCASTVVQSENDADLTKQRQQRKQEVIAQFESRRDNAQFLAAQQAWERGDKQGCRATLEEILARSPEHHAARIMLADLLLVDGAVDSAERHLQFVLDRKPDHAPAHHSLALLYESSQRPEQAIAQYRKAIQLDPSNELYRLGLDCCQPTDPNAEGRVQFASDRAPSP